MSNLPNLPNKPSTPSLPGTSAADILVNVSFTIRNMSNEVYLFIISIALPLFLRLEERNFYFLLKRNKYTSLGILYSSSLHFSIL